MPDRVNNGSVGLPSARYRHDFLAGRQGCRPSNRARRSDQLKMRCPDACRSSPRVFLPGSAPPRIAPSRVAAHRTAWRSCSGSPAGIVFVGVGIVAVHQLHVPRPRRSRGGIGEHLHDAHAFDLDHHLEGRAKNESPTSTLGRVAETTHLAVGRPRLSSEASTTFVMQQGCGMNELDHCRELMVGGP